MSNICSLTNSDNNRLQTDYRQATAIASLEAEWFDTIGIIIV